MDYVYERIRLPEGIKVEIVTGGGRYKGKVWREIARQIYCENGKDGFREIGHFRTGAPFLHGNDERISISHTEGCLAVATIKTKKDSKLSEFEPETALGIDVENAGRNKVLDVREKFLTEDERKLVDADSTEANILAWTCKEAMLKAGMSSSIDWLRNITITDMPTPETPGKGYILLDEMRYYFRLYTLRYGDYIITVACSEKDK